MLSPMKTKDFVVFWEKNYRVICMFLQKWSFSLPGISCAFTINSESTLLWNTTFKMNRWRTCHMLNIKQALYIFKNLNYKITSVVCVHLCVCMCTCLRQCVDSLTPRLIPFIFCFTPFLTLNSQPHFLSYKCPWELYGLTWKIL